MGESAHRASGHALPDANGDSQPDSDRDGDCHTYADFDTDRNRNANCYEYTINPGQTRFRHGCQPKAGGSRVYFSASKVRYNAKRRGKLSIE